MLPTKFRFNWPISFRGTDFFQNLTNQKQELPVAAMFVNGSELNEHIYRGPSIHASYQFSVHLANRFQRKRSFRNRPIRNKNCLWRPCVNGSGQHEQSLQMLTTKFQFIWPRGFRGKDLEKSSNQKQELPVAAMFVDESGQDEQSLQRAFYGCFLPSFSSFGQSVSEKKIIQKSTNQKQELSMVAHVC